MNIEDQFEQRLRSQPQRPTPAAWREEILGAAQAAARAVPSSDGLSFFARLNLRLSALFWPHPVAWGGLAAVWLLIIGLNFAGHQSGHHQDTKAAGPISGEVRQLLRQQEQLFAELSGKRDETTIDHPKPATISPQSRRREDFAFA